MPSNPDPLWFVPMPVGEWFTNPGIDGLTDRQAGWYIRLYLACWRGGGSLSSDLAELTKIARSGKKAFAKDRHTVLALFPLDETTNRRTHPYLQAEYASAIAAIERKKARGRQ